MVWIQWWETFSYSGKPLPTVGLPFGSVISLAFDSRLDFLFEQSQISPTVSQGGKQVPHGGKRSPTVGNGLSTKLLVVMPYVLDPV